MGDKTNIEWTDATWNPIRGCSRISEGCRNCYAESVANRFKGKDLPYEGLIASTGQWNGKIKVVENAMDQPFRWQKPRRIFVNSMSDLFHENLHIDQIARIFAVMYLNHRHTFQVLTKRAKRMHDILNSQEFYAKVLHASFVFRNDENLKDFGGSISDPTKFPHQNVWVGVSVEDQKTAEERIPLLLETPAAIRWISAEPLIGPIDFSGMWVDFENPAIHINMLEQLNWIVVGGESGTNARPMNPDWVRTIKAQCLAVDVPFFFKQWGEFAPNWFNDDNGKKIQGSEWIDRIGKKLAGRTLDGEIWNQYPEAFDSYDRKI